MDDNIEPDCENCQYRGIDGGPSAVMVCNHPKANNMGYIIYWKNAKRSSDDCPLVLGGRSTKNSEKCPSCGYTEEVSKWSVINITSSDGYGGVIILKYNTKEGSHTHVGRVDLLSCPLCKTIVWRG